MKFKERLAQFYSGRNGVDELARFHFWTVMVCCLLGWIAGLIWSEGSGISLALMVLGVWAFFRYLWRTMSRKLDKRRVENEGYLALTGRVKAAFTGAKTRFSQRREYIFFRCPKCRARLRVPRGKGTIMVTCRACGERFRKKT